MIVPLFVSTGKRAVAVLTPQQESLIDSFLNADYKIRKNFLLQTAVRIVEGRFISQHPECYRKENAAVFLPKVEEIGKKRCTIDNRAVMLSPDGIKAVEDFFDKKVGLPSYQAMEPAFKRAAKRADIDTRYITSKMYRKTMISWLINVYPERKEAITHFAGHDDVTMLNHYITYGFRKDDVKDMKDRVAGWGVQA